MAVEMPDQVTNDASRIASIIEQHDFTDMRIALAKEGLIVAKIDPIMSPAFAAFGKSQEKAN